MVNQELVNYIQEARKAGQSEEQIRTGLAGAGWAAGDIEAGFKAVAGKAGGLGNLLAGRRRTMTALTALGVIILAAGAFLAWQKGWLGGRPGATGSPITAITEFIKPAFAKYELEKTAVKASVPGYTLALSEISNLDSFGAFSDGAKAGLLKNNFFIAGNSDNFYDSDAAANTRRVDDWVDLYEKIGGSWMAWERQPQNSVFITSDFLLHVYHRLIEKEFEYIEQANFYPALSEITASLLKSAAESYAKSGADQRASYERLSSYFLVPAAILGTAADDYGQFKSQNFVADSQNDTKEAALRQAESLAAASGLSSNAGNIAKQEIELIFRADQLAISPLMGKYQAAADLSLPEDYTQFLPRSHYAKNAILRDYFRAMMWYGRMNFLLDSPDLTRDAANISVLLKGDNFKKWESIYLPTAFFVGQSDDLGVYEYQQAMAKTGFDATGSSQAVSRLQAELKTYKNPQIMSSAAVGEGVLDLSKEELQNKTKGFRFMGQRFTPDAFVFSTLTQGDEKPDPKTGQKLPSTPTALMIPTLMDSRVAEGLLGAWIKAEAPSSDQVIADRLTQLETYFNGLTTAQWTQNIYWSWLYTLKSVLTDNLDKNGYPMFVKSEDWDKKNLQCFLGSWTELKHDTLLYAKQSYAELGAGGEEGEPKPVPRGYVEPNVEFWDRLIALAGMSRDGLKQFGLLPDTFESRNKTLIEAAQFYRQIAVAELQNQKISDDDFEKLRLSAGRLRQILGAIGGEQLTEKDARSALIADVHTDVKKQQILYEANGLPNYIYVAVKDANGTRLTKGLVYAYYEFTAPLGKRLTDADWQTWAYVDKAQLPAMADWSRSLIK